MSNQPAHFLLICSTCQGTQAADKVFASLMGSLPDGYVIKEVRCMAGCDRPTTIGFQSFGKAQYLFGDIATEQDLEAVAEFAGQYSRSADGWTNATDRPPALFTKTLSRIPWIDGEVTR